MNRSGVTRDDLILNTKENCYLGVIQEKTLPKKNERLLMFGSLKRNYDDKNDAISFKSYLIFDLNTFQIKEIKREGGEFKNLKPENFVVGQQLLHTLGGDKKTNELLDQLGHQFSNEKYKEYKNTIDKLRNEQKEKLKLQKKETKAKIAQIYGPGYHPRLDKLEEIGRGVALGVLMAGGVYLMGYYPWKIGPKTVSKDVENYKGYEKGLLVLPTTIANLIILGGYRINAYPTTAITPHMLNHINDIAYMTSHDSTMYGLFYLATIPLITAGAKGIYEGAKALVGLVKERKERQAERMRLERLRQAFCPADSEKFYTM
ncbi:MAG: hypothetical protein KGH71_03145 [Candidatus Micrarchaeota archaeon]|nr:hypothetical protein [Candidatus Micrarchaeota archaeon]